MTYLYFSYSGDVSDPGLHPPTCLAPVYDSVLVGRRDRHILSRRPGLREAGGTASESVHADHHPLPETSSG